MDIAQIKKNLNYHDLLSWKNPVLTAVVLVLLNIATLTFNSMGMSIVNFALYKIVVYSLIFGLKEKFTGSSKDKEYIEKLFHDLYTYTNSALDHLRRMMLLEDLQMLAKVVLPTLFVIYFGQSFSSFSLVVIGINLYTISQFSVIKERAELYYGKALQVTGDLVGKYIPKYVE